MCIRDSWNACLAAPLPEILPLGAAPPLCMTPNPAMDVPAFDPLSQAALIGSGPWTCQNTGTNPGAMIGAVGTGCSSSNTQSPPVGGTLTLTRFGCSLATNSCLSPAASLASLYFRSSGNLALYIWSQMDGQFTLDFLSFSVIANCFNKPIGTVGCTHWQQGIGNPNGPGIIGINQVSILARFVGVSWISPSLSNQVAWNLLTGIAPAAAGELPGGPNNVGNILLFERTSATLVPSYTLNPAAAVGCVGPSFPNGGGYDC